MPPKTVSLARSHLSFTLIHYLTNEKKNCVYNPDSILFVKNLYAKKHNVPGTLQLQCTLKSKLLCKESLRNFIQKTTELQGPLKWWGRIVNLSGQAEVLRINQSERRLIRLSAATRVHNITKPTSNSFNLRTDPLNHLWIEGWEEWIEGIKEE